MRDDFYFCKMAVSGPVGERGGDICCSLNKMPMAPRPRGQLAPGSGIGGDSQC